MEAHSFVLPPIASSFIQLLPPELLFVVLSYTAADIVAAACVCKAWRAAAFDGAVMLSVGRGLVASRLQRRLPTLFDVGNLHGFLLECNAALLVSHVAGGETFRRACGAAVKLCRARTLGVSPLRLAAASAALAVAAFVRPASVDVRPGGDVRDSIDDASALLALNTALTCATRECVAPQQLLPACCDADAVAAAATFAVNVASLVAVALNELDASEKPFADRWPTARAVMVCCQAAVRLAADGRAVPAVLVETAVRLLPWSAWLPYTEDDVRHGAVVCAMPLLCVEMGAPPRSPLWDRHWVRTLLDISACLMRGQDADALCDAADQLLALAGRPDAATWNFVFRDMEDTLMVALGNRIVKKDSAYRRMQTMLRRTRHAMVQCI